MRWSSTSSNGAAWRRSVSPRGRRRFNGECRQLDRALSALGMLLFLFSAGCASPPPVHLYTLMPAERPAPRAEGSAPQGRGAAIVLEGISVPAQVDQPQWLIRLPDGTLALLEQERWAGPLPDELHRALLEILTQRFGAVEMRSAAPGMSLWRIRVDVTRFETMPGEARLEATWTVTPRTADTPALRCTSYLRESAGAGMPALAEAHRRAVARLGDAIGEQLLALQRGESGRCAPEQ